MKKALLIFFLILMASVSAALFFLLSNLGGIIKTTLETTGTDMLGEPVSVGNVDISLRSGAGEITGFRIDNPEGYTDPEAFSMDRIRLNLDLRSVRGTPVRLEEFILEAPEVYLEVRDDNQVNLEELALNLRKNIQRAEKEEKENPEPPASEEEKAAATLLAIDHLKIAGVKLTVRHRKFEEGVREIVLPDIDLRNVGGTEGVTGAKIGLEVVEAITKEGLKQALRAEAEKQAGRLLQKGLERLSKDPEGGQDSDP